MKKIIVKSIYALMFVLLLSSVIMTGCKKEKEIYENKSPVASFSISSKSSSTLGHIGSLFKFDASACSDDSTPISELMVRWDFDGDGIYDTEWSTDKLSSYKYTKEGEYTINIEVKDEEEKVCVESKSLTIISPTFTDSRDNKTYKTVIIGKQVWMAENLAYEIPGKEIQGSMWSRNKAYDAWCYYENDKITYGESCGIFYQWEAALSACPSGWHIPSKKEWNELKDYLANNGYNYDGTIGGREYKIGKSIATNSDWKISTVVGAVGDNQENNNSSGFAAFPTGLRMHYMGFMYLSLDSYWWTSTEYYLDSACGINLYYKNRSLEFVGHSKTSGMPIRCVLD